MTFTLFMYSELLKILFDAYKIDNKFTKYGLQNLQIKQTYFYLQIKQIMMIESKKHISQNFIEYQTQLRNFN